MEYFCLNSLILRRMTEHLKTSNPQEKLLTPHTRKIVDNFVRGGRTILGVKLLSIELLALSNILAPNAFSERTFLVLPSRIMVCVSLRVKGKEN